MQQTARSSQPAQRTFGGEGSRHFDHLQIARIASGRSTILASQADSTMWPFLAVYSIAGGATVESSERFLRLDAGDLTIVRNTAAAVLASGVEGDILVIRMPNGTVGPHVPVLDASDGHTWSTRQGTASLVGHLLDAIANQPADYLPTNPARLAQHIVGLISLMCAEEVAADSSDRTSLLQRSKEYIEVHLGDVYLSPGQAASVQHVSTRTLYRLFESDGQTIGSWIRMRRLEQCRADLKDVASDHLTVSAIGAKWGLCDAAHFSRLFKSCYGLSPRAYRVAHRSHFCDENCISGKASA